MHYFQFNIGDYIKSTNHLSIEEDIIYRRLLDLYYDTEEPIPNDNPWVIRRLRLGSGHSEKLEIILNEFFTLTDNGRENKRCKEEIEGYKGYIEKQKANGSKGGRPKKPTANPTVNPNVTQKNPKQEPLTTNQCIREKAKRFIPPDIKLITDYFVDRGSTKLEAEKFFYFYDSKNWKVGKNTMQKWKSSASGWMARNGTIKTEQQEATWDSSWAGIEEKGLEHGISQGDNEPPYEFKQRVINEVAKHDRPN